MKKKVKFYDRITVVALVAEKYASIGFAVCDEQDKFNAELGERIAEGRARLALGAAKGQNFRRPDVWGDFALCGLDVRNMKALPKSIFINSNSIPPSSIRVLPAAMIKRITA
jgi:hypothetical protein